MAPGVLVAESPAEVSITKPLTRLDSATKQDSYGSYYPMNPDKLDLESNFGPMQPGTVGYLQPTSADAPLEVMHERYQKDGYLFVCQSCVQVSKLSG